MGQLVAVCKGRRRLHAKQNVGEGDLTPEAGLVGDVGTGASDAQVTMLALELIERIRRQFMLEAGPGDFGENLTVEGVDIASFKAGDRLRVGEAVLEVVRVGEPDAFVHLGHYQGISLLPEWGLYARVAVAGHVATGNTVAPAGA